MRRSDSLTHLGGFGIAVALGAVLIVTMAEASLPTGGMLRQQPRGPARADMPASTSILVYRIPSAVAYGLQPGQTAPPRVLADDDSVYGVLLPETSARAIEALQVNTTDVYAGLRGVCVVTLRDERRLVTPRPELYSMFAGRRYEFATAEAKIAFDSNPLVYAPVLEGRDIVLTVAGIDEAVGSLRHAGFYRERLFLFQSAENLLAFSRDPRRYAGR